MTNEGAVGNGSDLYLPGDGNEDEVTCIVSIHFADLKSSVVYDIPIQTAQTFMFISK